MAFRCLASMDFSVQRQLDFPFVVLWMEPDFLRPPTMRRAQVRAKRGPGPEQLGAPEKVSPPLPSGPSLVARWPWTLGTPILFA